MSGKRSAPVPKPFLPLAEMEKAPAASPRKGVGTRQKATPGRRHTDDIAAKPREITGNSFKMCSLSGGRRGGEGREKGRELVRLRSSASHVPREAELKFQSQNTCGLKEDKLQESFNIMRHFGLDVLFAQETWRLTTNDTDLRDYDGHLVIEHGLTLKRCRRGSLGLATILNGRCRAAFERAGYQKLIFGERIMATRLLFRDDKGQKVRFYLVNAYAPYDAGTVKSRKLIEAYYEELRSCLKMKEKDEILIGATDANASMGTRAPGSDEETPRVVGRFGNAHTNWAGDQLRDFCTEHTLCSPTTFFCKKEYNTWKNPRNRRGYQIDHFLISQNDMKRVRDSGVNRKHSPALHSDHAAVYLRIRLARSLSKASQKVETGTWCNKDRLRQADVKAQFMTTVIREYKAGQEALTTECEEKTDITVDQAWECYAEAMKAAEKLHLTERRSPQIKGWFALRQETLTRTIETRNEAMAALMSCRGDAELHKSCRDTLRSAATRVKQEVKLAQEEWLAIRIAEVGEFQHPAVYWRAIKDLKSGLDHCKIVIPLRFASKEDPSKTCTTAAENADRARDHFDEVFNRPDSYSADQIERVRQREVRHELDDLPSAKEVRETIAACKEAAAGKDRLPPLYFKAIADVHLEESQEVFDIFMQILEKIWWGGKIPEAWREGLLTIIYKNKGPKKNLDNYRGIVLKAVAVKILGAVIQRRLQKIVGEEGLEEQFAYSAGKSSQHATFCVKTAMQKRREHGLPTWVCFVDLVKAFDSVPRKALMRVLEKFGVPPRMLEVIIDLHKGISISLKVADEKRYFNSTTGVLQGSTEAPALFLLYMQACLEVYDLDNTTQPLRFLYREDTELTGRPVMCSQRDQGELEFSRTLFADDAAILWETRYDMSVSLNCLFSTMEDFGIHMHVGTPGKESKTVCMQIPQARHARQEPRTEVKLGPTGKHLCRRCSGSSFFRQVCQSPVCYREAQDKHLKEQGNGSGQEPDLSDIPVGHGSVHFVEKFKYLGSIIHRSLDDAEDVKARIAAATQAFGSLKSNLLTNKRLPLKVRMNVMNSFILSVLCYGLETWTLTAKSRDKLVTFHRRCIRQVVGISWGAMWKGRISQETIERMAGVRDLETLLLRRRLKWLGKLAARPETLPGKFLSCWVPNPRPVGRPQKSLAHAYVADLRGAGLGDEDWRKQAKESPEEWAAVVINAQGPTRTSRKALQRDQAQIRKREQAHRAWQLYREATYARQLQVASTLLPAVTAARMHAAAGATAVAGAPPPPPPPMTQAMVGAPPPPPPPMMLAPPPPQPLLPQPPQTLAPPPMTQPTDRPPRTSRSGRVVVQDYKELLRGRPRG